jgi:hypothetical protein
MYEPVMPPGTEDGYGLAANSIPAYGKLGYSSSTTPLTAKGLRHGGALTIQVIKAATPQNALELSVPNHPEYGWRVKSALFSTYVLAEYNTYWHHPNGKCMGTSGWTKLAPEDPISDANPQTPDTGSSDPKIGTFTASTGGATTITTPPPTVGTTTATVTNAAAGTTTTTVKTVVKNADGSYSTTTNITIAPIAKTTGTTTSSVTNPDGTITTTSTTVVKNADGSYTTTTAILSGPTGTLPALGTTTNSVTNPNGSVTTTTTTTLKDPVTGVYTTEKTVATSAYAAPLSTVDAAALAEAKTILAAGPKGISSTVVNQDGSKTTTTKTAVKNADGSYTITTSTSTDGGPIKKGPCTNVSVGGVILQNKECPGGGPGEYTPATATKRINWRELMTS